MVAFKISVSCPNCGNRIVQDGWMQDYSTDAPIIDLSFFACEQFECRNCGTTVYTGDEESMYEYEDPPEDFSPEEDDDWDDEEDDEF